MCVCVSVRICLSVFVCLTVFLSVRVCVIMLWVVGCGTLECYCMHIKELSFFSSFFFFSFFFFC